MNINKFNKIFSKTCDEIYAIVGDKQHYRKEDAEKMLDGATPIILNIFGIHEQRFIACRNKTNRIGERYLEGMQKTMGFEAAILAMTFGVLEGTGEIKEGAGMKLMADSIAVGGLKMSRTQE